MRFYAPDAERPGESVRLPAEEAAHLTRVLRVKPGDAVRVFNGRWGEFEAVVERAAADGTTVRIDAPCDPVPEPTVALTLAQAVLKGDRMDDVIRDAVMIGFASIQPMVSARTEATLEALERGHRRERWERIAISSAKQCGRAVVPPVLSAVPFEALLNAIAGTVPAPALMFVEPGASEVVKALSAIETPETMKGTVVIGPVGGWTDVEVEEGARCCTLLTLGARTLRADAMPTVAFAALFARWNAF